MCKGLLCKRYSLPSAIVIAPGLVNKCHIHNAIVRLISPLLCECLRHWSLMLYLLKTCTFRGWDSTVIVIAALVVIIITTSIVIVPIIPIHRHASILIHIISMIFDIPSFMSHSHTQMFIHFQTSTIQFNGRILFVIPVPLSHWI